MSSRVSSSPFPLKHAIFTLTAVLMIAVAMAIASFFLSKSTPVVVSESTDIATIATKSENVSSAEIQKGELERLYAGIQGIERDIKKRNLAGEQFDLLPRSEDVSLARNIAGKEFVKRRNLLVDRYNEGMIRMIAVYRSNLPDFPTVISRWSEDKDIFAANERGTETGTRKKRLTSGFDPVPATLTVPGY